jgi:hypothetical protein
VITGLAIGIPVTVCLIGIIGMIGFFMYLSRQESSRMETHDARMLNPVGV